MNRSTPKLGELVQHTFFYHFCAILQFSCLILFKQNFFGVLLYVQAPDEPKVEKLGTVDFPINPCINWSVTLKNPL